MRTQWRTVVRHRRGAQEGPSPREIKNVQVVVVVGVLVIVVVVVIDVGDKNEVLSRRDIRSLFTNFGHLRTWA